MHSYSPWANVSGTRTKCICSQNRQCCWGLLDIWKDFGSPLLDILQECRLAITVLNLSIANSCFLWLINARGMVNSRALNLHTPFLLLKWPHCILIHVGKKVAKPCPVGFPRRFSHLESQGEPVKLYTSEDWRQCPWELACTPCFPQVILHIPK